MAEDILQRLPVVLAKTQADDMKLQINAVIKRLDQLQDLGEARENEEDVRIWKGTSASDVICSAVRVGEARQGGEGEPAQMGFKAAVPFVGMTMAECAQVGIMTFSKAAMSIGMSNFVSPLL
ncbi:hypothetical protein NC653_025052 [Populus alba x Populus x berolinensis]|uniref:Uncharacterized protein n=1 Tax=Populus alba x Populus x berolinensis TaxID=444605 RepID=A0AAD6Q7I7_9ROSI|nr:hypothetical protein NC653_025052 [Populus alba x Populus x berolinensis]